MRFLLVSVIFVLLLQACSSFSISPIPQDRILDQVPLRYDDGSYSVAGLIAEKQANESYLVKGFVTDTYECPPCPPGAMCKPCAPPHIRLADPLANVSQSEIVVTFENRKSPGDPAVAEAHARLSVGDEVTLNVIYLGTDASGAYNQHGMFSFERVEP